MNAPSNSDGESGRKLAETAYIRLAARDLQEELATVSEQASAGESFDEADNPKGVVSFLQAAAVSVSQGKVAQRQLAAQAIVYSQLQHIVDSNQSAPEAVAAAETIIQNTRPEVTEMATRQAKVLQGIDISTPELRTLSGTPPKTTAARGYNLICTSS